MALGALTLDVTVGQEHALDGVKELFDLTGADQALSLEGLVNALRQLDIFGGVGRVPVIKPDMKTVQVLGAFVGVAFHQRLGRDVFGFGLEHDGRTVRVVGTHKMYGMTRHSHGSDPDVGLDVFHDVADVEGTVGVGEGGGDK